MVDFEGLKGDENTVMSSLSVEAILVSGVRILLELVGQNFKTADEGTGTGPKHGFQKLLLHLAWDDNDDRHL